MNYARPCWLALLFLPALGCPRPGSAPSATRGLFRDATAESGLRYTWTAPQKRPLNLLETVGNGCAFLDYNNDSNLDILLVGPKPALFTGDGKGTFTEATALLGGVSGHFLGCAVGDYDSDGFPDLYLSGYRDGRLLHNDGGKGFTDVTAISGLRPQPWGTACAFVETVPGSGKLDLVVANYVRFDPDKGDRALCDFRDASGKTQLAACGPREYSPLPAELFRNLGGGKFQEATKGSGVETTHGRGLGLAVDDQGALAFANDEAPGDLLRRGPSGRFTNEGDVSGTAYDHDGKLHGGMGADWGDSDGDGQLDLAVATFKGEPNSLYHADGGGLFTDVGYKSGLGVATQPYVAFGCRFFDFDNDGWLDLAFTNGHIQDNIETIDPATRYRQPSQLFRNTGKGVFVDHSAAAGPALQKPLVGRGLATGDYDNDGRIDLLLVDGEGSVVLLHNEATAGHWLGLRLVSGKRDAFGARVSATVGGQTLVRHCHPEGSYLSASDPRVHVGLGSATTAPTIDVVWPSGRKESFSGLTLDRYQTLTEGAGK